MSRRGSWVGGGFALIVSLWVAWGACWTSSGSRPTPDPGISVPPIEPRSYVLDPACSAGRVQKACQDIQSLADVVIGLPAEEYLTPVRIVVTSDRRVRYEARVLLTTFLDFAVRDFDSMFTSPIYKATIAPDSTPTMRHYSLIDADRGGRYDARLAFQQTAPNPSPETTVDVVIELLDPFPPEPAASLTTRR